MGQTPSLLAHERGDSFNDNDAALPLGRASPDYASIWSGCSAPACADSANEHFYGSSPLSKVVQQCCLSSEREGMQELVEQKPVIGDEVTYVDDAATPATSSSGGMKQRRGFQRNFLVVSPQQHRRFDQCYELLDQIGEGSFGNVYKAFCLCSKPGTVKRQVAVKIFSTRAIRATAESPKGLAKLHESEEGKKRLTSFLAESAMLSRLEHPHVVRMHECFQAEHELHIVLEICHGGELYNCLVDRIKELGSGGLPEGDVKHFLRQMLWAVVYLHANRIVHRDIKPENFLLFGKPNSPEANVLKLCDFGTAMVLTERKPRSMVHIGTLSYTAPEVYCHKGADLPADTWSLGVVLYVMLTGTNPFRGGKDCTKQETVKKIKSGLFATQRSTWLKLPEPAQDMVKRFLVLAEELRSTAPEALSHVWLVDAPLSKTLSSEEDSEMLAVAAFRLALQMANLQEPQRLALAACAMATTEAELGQSSVWRSLFTTLDQDIDGRLSLDEFCGGLRKLAGIPLSEVSETDLMAAALVADTDGSGAIEWAEWLALALLGQKQLSKEEVLMSNAHRLVDRPLGDQADQKQVAHRIQEYARGLRPVAHEEDGDYDFVSKSDFCLVLASCHDERCSHLNGF